MDFTKFCSLLNSKALYFANTYSFNDPFEGSRTKANVEALSKSLHAGWKSVGFSDEEIAEKRLANSSSFSIIWEKALSEFVINCWHVSEHESAAMWDLYLKSGEGIAINSTFGRLKGAFQQTSQTVYMGLVKYIDYRTEAIIPHNQHMAPFFYKRKSFEHERELRIIAPVDPEELTGKKHTGLIRRDSKGRIFNERDEHLNDRTPRGVRVPVIIDELIGSVYLSPTAPVWFTQLVVDMLDKFGVSKQVYRSSLNEDSVF